MSQPSTSTKLTSSQHDALVYLTEVGHASTKAVARSLYGGVIYRSTPQQIVGARQVLNHLEAKGLITKKLLTPSAEGIRWDITEEGRKATERKAAQP